MVQSMKFKRVCRADVVKHGAQAMLLGLAVTISGCDTHVNNAGGSNFPAASATTANRPYKVLVADFPASPDVVQLDTSPGVQLQRAAAQLSASQAKMQDVSEVQDVLATTLVEKIQQMGLSAERVAAGTQPAENELLVSGEITSIQEGNRTRRTVVGLGAGKSVVAGSAELSLGTATGPQLLQNFDVSATSGRMPGMGIGAAAGGVKSAATVLSGGAHAAGEMKATQVEERAASFANHLSASLSQYFAAQHWIPAP